MSRYLVTACDEMTGCSEVGRANRLDTAQKKAVKAARRRAKRWAGLPVPEGQVKAEVYEVDRGHVAADPVYTAIQEYGAPRRGRARRRKPARYPITEPTPDG